MASEKRLIDANELLRDINNYYDSSPFPHPGTNWRRGFEFAAELILFAPTVDAVEVVHGRWLEDAIERRNEFPLRMYECTECGGIVYRHKFNYCPNCGAKMDGDGNGTA